MTANATPRDDLTAISGIGPVRQQWLREELEVDTYQDLAAFTVDELEAQMREAGKSVSRSDIEHWLHEAQRLSGSEATAEEANSPEEKWKPFASFVVEYQEREGGEGRRTTVHHMEKDKDADWLGIVRAELCQWMLEQAGETVPDLEALEQEIREDAQERLQEELEEREREARRQLEQALAEERAAAEQALEEEMARRREATVRAVEADIAEERAQARQELERELAARRAASIQALEQEVEERRAEEAMEGVVEAPAREPPTLEEAVETEEEAVAQPPLEAADEMIAFAVTEIRGYQPPYIGEPRTIEETDVAPAQLRRDFPFALVILFRLEAADARALAAKGATYTAQIYARNLSTGKTRQLGRTPPSSFVEGRMSYTDTLSNIELAAGAYQLTVFVTTETTPPGLGSRVVPMLLIA